MKRKERPYSFKLAHKNHTYPLLCLQQLAHNVHGGNHGRQHKKLVLRETERASIPIPHCILEPEKYKRWVLSLLLFCGLRPDEVPGCWLDIVDAPPRLLCKQVEVVHKSKFHQKKK